MHPDIRQRNRITACLFLVSAAGLIFEITLTRVFSLFFQYHYAFLAVSLAVLGISLGAALGRFVTPSSWIFDFRFSIFDCSASPSETGNRKPEFGNRHGAESATPLFVTLIALSLSFPVAAALLAWLPAAGSVWPRAMVALPPFALIGLFSALAFARFAPHAGLLYGADLTGAAVGVISALGLLTVANAFSMMILLGAVAGLAAVWIFDFRFSISDCSAFQSEIENRKSKILSGSQGLKRYLRGPVSLKVAWLALLLSVVLLGVNVFTGWIDYSPARLTSAPRDKTMIAVLKDPSQAARVVYTAGSPFARVDVVETTDPDTKFVFTDGGAGSLMLRFDGDLGKHLEPLRDSVEFIPFALGRVEQTLIIGAGAGRDVVLALLAGADRITAVEVNPAIVEATRHFAAYNGHILDRPEVELVVGDARTFVERTPGQYDLIYLNLVYTQAAEPASQALVENYIFTRQAFRAYLERLAPGGRLAIVSHSALEGSRAALTALQALADEGVALSRALDHMALWMLPTADPTLRTSVLVLGREPLSEPLMRELLQRAGQQSMEPLFMPQQYEFPFAPLRRGMSMDEFVEEDAPYELGPTDDDRPYFFKLDPGLPAPVLQALVAAAALAAVLLAVSVWQRGARGEGRQWVGFVVYATLIGAGFMLVEIPLIQRFQLLLGYPVLSVAAVLGTLLVASGAGSLLSQRWPEAGLLQRVIVAALWIVAVAVVYWLALPWLVRRLLAAPLIWRLLATIGLTALLGIPMGVPFPSLMRLAGKYRQRVALLLAINGAFSVLGSAMAVAISMTWGFSRVIATGAGLYLLLSALAWGLNRETI